MGTTTTLTVPNFRQNIVCVGSVGPAAGAGRPSRVARGREPAPRKGNTREERKRESFFFAHPLPQYYRGGGGGENCQNI